MLFLLLIFQVHGWASSNNKIPKLLALGNRRHFWRGCSWWGDGASCVRLVVRGIDSCRCLWQCLIWFDHRDQQLCRHQHHRLWSRVDLSRRWGCWRVWHPCVLVIVVGGVRRHRAWRWWSRGHHLLRNIPWVIFPSWTGGIPWGWWVPFPSGCSLSFGFDSCSWFLGGCSSPSTLQCSDGGWFSTSSGVPLPSWKWTHWSYLQIEFPLCIRCCPPCPPPRTRNYSLPFRSPSRCWRPRTFPYLRWWTSPFLSYSYSYDIISAFLSLLSNYQVVLGFADHALRVLSTPQEALNVDRVRAGQPLITLSLIADDASFIQYELPLTPKYLVLSILHCGYFPLLHGDVLQSLHLRLTLRHQFFCTPFPSWVFGGSVQQWSTSSDGLWRSGILSQQ